jgi:hypothetical protein
MIELATVHHHLSLVTNIAFGVLMLVVLGLIAFVMVGNHRSVKQRSITSNADSHTGYHGHENK